MSDKKFDRVILVTGGAGFIGSHLVRHLVKKYPDYRIICFDDLTYAGNIKNLSDIEDRENYIFLKGDICDMSLVDEVMSTYKVDSIIHLAAESHVDRSIRNPLQFARTNVMGTLTLLEVARRNWEKNNFEGNLFYHVSTDEVYGALELDHEAVEPPFGKELFSESTPYNPHSPYSASKAASDHFVRSYHDTYGMPVVISNCSNNYGPYQFPEKLLPLVINNIRNKKPLPIYGKGENVRDWLYVTDHVEAIDAIFHKGRTGETYNIGTSNEWKNIDLVKVVIEITDRLLGNPEGESLNLITFVTDRKGHDLRYAIDASKIRSQIGWTPLVSFREGIEKTVRWYLENDQWLDDVTSGDYMKYYDSYYGKSK